MVQLRIILGWVERSETQQSTENVGFRPSNATCLSRSQSETGNAY
ncbi:hypothetical protein [Nostoc sp.]